MSHNIEDNMIAWKGEKPWHGLGYEVLPEATGEEMLKTAKLNWAVRRRSLAMKSLTNSTLTKQLAAWKAIVRDDTNEVFAVMSAKYQPIQNREIVDFFKEYCEAGNARIETVGGLYGGRIVWALAKLLGGDANIGDCGDEMKGYILLANSHDGSLRFIATATGVYVVCWNTLSAAVAPALAAKKGQKIPNVFMMKHTKKFTADVAAEAKRTMGLAVEQQLITADLANQLSKITVDEIGKREFVTRVLGTYGPDMSLLNLPVAKGDEDPYGRVGMALLEAINTSPGHELESRNNTLWGCVNGVTYFNDHVRCRKQDSALNGTLFSREKPPTKADAIAEAVKMGGITINV